MGGGLRLGSMDLIRIINIMEPEHQRLGGYRERPFQHSTRIMS